MVHFKVFGGGITLTDAQRKLFFRRHYPANGVSYAGIDPEDRHYQYQDKGALTKKYFFLINILTLTICEICIKIIY